MKLISLTLENIKSYLEENICFFDGINFISGVNGAGKTTIIEAVGYALFDANPFSSLRQFIREGEKSGTITVVVEASDERLYRIVRRLRLPSGGSWSVYDEESGMELGELHGSQDVKDWLAENLGIARGLEPTLLFEDVVGISQGQFTAPFLERPARRKEIFNTILQLEGYREAFEKTRGLDSLLEKRIHSREREKSGMLVRVEDIEECREQLNTNQNQALILREGLETLVSKLGELVQGISEQEQLKEQTEKGHKELQGLQIRLEGLRTQKERITRDIDTAQKCRETIERVTPGYLEYRKVQNYQKELETRRKERDSLNIELQDLQNRTTAQKAQLLAEKENRTRQICEGEAELKELTAEGELSAALKKEVEEKKRGTENNQEELKIIQNCWQFIEQALNRCQQGKAVLETLDGNCRQMQEETAGLEQALKNWDEAQRLTGEVPGLEKGLELVQETFNQVRAKATSLEDNRKAARGGMCPFLQMPCSNVEGDLEKYFTGELEKIAPELECLRQKKEEMENKLAAARKGQEEYYLLQHQKSRLEQLNKQISETEQAVLKEKYGILEILQVDSMEPLRQSLNQAEKVLDKAGILPDEGYFQDKALFAEQVDEYIKLYRQVSSVNETAEIVEGMNSLPGLLAEIKSRGGILWNKLETGMKDLLQKLNAEMAAHDSRLNSLRERYRKVSDSLRNLKEDKSIENKERGLEADEKKLRMLGEKAARYDSLEEEWEKNKGMINRFEPDYLQYMQNIEGARRMEKLITELQSLQAAEQNNLQEIKKLQELLQQLNDRYKSDLLAGLKVKRDELVEEKVKKEAALEHTSREVEQYQRLVREKEQILQEIRMLEKEVDKEKKAQQLLNMVRATLNQSGEKIAEVYRQYLGREADLIYQQVARENVHLLWCKDYEVKINDNLEGKARERSFGQLSGGEKMTAALAIRLALLKQLSGLGVGFFDEPTANLDENRRVNLARIIPEITKTFRQVLVISHDDTFDSITENVIMLKKEHGRGTRIVGE